jgi:rhodanese-related sulfurtransferase
MATIDTQQLLMMLDSHDDMLLINTLPAESFEKTKIPGAVNIPQHRDDFVSRVQQEAGSKDRPIVVYCASEHCSSSEFAARKLASAGFTSVMHYHGGAEAWQQESQATRGTAAGSLAFDGADVCRV